MTPIPNYLSTYQLHYFSSFLLLSFWWVWRCGRGGNEGVGRRVEGCISTPIPNYLSTYYFLSFSPQPRGDHTWKGRREEKSSVGMEQSEKQCGKGGCRGESLIICLPTSSYHHIRVMRSGDEESRAVWKPHHDWIVTERSGFMKRIAKAGMAVGILFGSALVAYAITSLLFTQSQTSSFQKKTIFRFNLSTGLTSGEIGPGDSFSTSPMANFLFQLPYTQNGTRTPYGMKNRIFSSICCPCGRASSKNLWYDQNSWKLYSL